MSTPVVLSCAGISKQFRTARHRRLFALKDVTLSVSEHEILGVIGPNGAGKTTLVDVLAGVVLPSAGHVHAAGTIGYVPSGNRALYPRLTPLQNLEFFAAMSGQCRLGFRRRETILSALTLVGAGAVADVRVDCVSDGFAARVSLARALLTDPAILLLDEPARSIDPIDRPSVLRIIADYVRKRGRCAVMVTHDITDVFEICDRVAVLRAGELARVADVAAPGERHGLRPALQRQP